jgi:two-component system C4-dicarboxylate transport sensor histidine kinase DctB
MISKKSTALLVLTIGFVIAAVCATYVLAGKKAANDIREAGERQLQIVALNLESVLEKFETLPFALGLQADVGQALAHPGDAAVINRLNLTLQSIQRKSKVIAVYMLDRHGTTLASSNWDQPSSYVGKDFRFRPYFLEAIKGNAGRFYGIGTFGEPGYFIAQPIYPPGAISGAAAPIGVMAVKIDLAEFEHTWSGSEDPIALVDRSGVVFLSNRAAWKYHSLLPLDSAALHDIAGTHQYANHALTPVSSLPQAAQGGFGEHVTRPIGRLGWQLMLFPSKAHSQRVALLWTLAMLLLLAIAGSSVWAVYQRRRRLEERRESRNALQAAALELDQKIALRTQELLLANQDLEIRYVKLKETEHVLRATQNELVQAGKLAMLGQMAAGVTHELNQPLAAIRAFADNAVTFLTRGQAEQAKENLTHISAASARMGAIIGQLKGFARKSHETVSTVDLPDAINASTLLLRREFEQHAVHLDIDIREALQIVGDTVRTEQVLINLLHNAIDAVVAQPERSVSVLLEREANQAVIRVRDSGAGIPEQVAQHLFKPFFTTKPSGKGLGLGLAISSSIVQAMNGQLTAHNRAGGAEFVVRLPLLQTVES